MSKLIIDANTANLIKSLVLADKRIKESSISYGNLGGRNSLSIKLFYMTAAEAPNGLLMNAPHRYIMLHDDGSMVNLTGYKTAKFRQGKVDSITAFAEKLVKYMVKALDA
jgi:hypothetical protein